MVRLNHEPYMNHLSHPHQLELCNIDNQPQNRALCSGCKLQSSGFIYACKPCNFSLHTSCAEMPQLITHPCHPEHTLFLLPIPFYPQGQFNCDACNRRGNGFSYHCKLCDFDLHILCASKPLSVNSQFHPNHPLQLTFYPPYGIKGFSCDICKNIGAKQWLYRCNVCEFDVHLDCATAMTRPISQPQPPLHHVHSYPGTNTYQQQQPNYTMHSASLGAQPSNQQVYSNNNLMGAAMVQGFVEGAAQQVGQNFMQSVIGGGTETGDLYDVNGGGGGGGGDGGDFSGLDGGAEF